MNVLLRRLSFALISGIAGFLMLTTILDTEWTFPESFSQKFTDIWADGQPQKEPSIGHTYFQILEVQNVKLINTPQQFCPVDQKLSLIVGIFSSPKDAIRRHLIRKEWRLKVGSMREKWESGIDKNHTSINSSNLKSTNNSVNLTHAYTQNLSAHEMTFMMKDIKLLFVLGKNGPKHNPRAEGTPSLIKYESDTYNDILQYDILDIYQNLPFKTGILFKWVGENCPLATFLLKVDDDIDVEVEGLVRLLYLYKYRDSIDPGTEKSDQKIINEKEETSSDKSTKLYNNLWRTRRSGRSSYIYCHMWKNMGVIRDINHRNHVNKSQYPYPLYPPYCSGWAYILSPLLALRLYRQTMESNSIPNEDAFWTGIVPPSTDAKIRPLNEFYGYGDGMLSSTEFIKSLPLDAVLKMFRKHNVTRGVPIFRSPRRIAFPYTF